MATSTIKKDERRKLLWTNPNPTSAFAGQKVTLSETFERYEIEFTGYINNPNYRSTQIVLAANITPIVYVTGATGDVSGYFYTFKRMVWGVNDGLSFGDVYSCTTTGSWSRYTANTGIVPYRIWGLKD